MRTLSRFIGDTESCLLRVSEMFPDKQRDAIKSEMRGMRPAPPQGPGRVSTQARPGCPSGGIWAHLQRRQNEVPIVVICGEKPPRKRV